MASQLDYPLTAMLALGTNPHSFLGMSNHQLTIHTREKAFLGQDRLIKKPIFESKHYDPLTMLAVMEQSQYTARDISYRDCLVLAASTRAEVILIKIETCRLSFADPAKVKLKVNRAGYLAWGEGTLDIPEHGCEVRPFLAVSQENSLVFIAPVCKKNYLEDEKIEIEWLVSQKVQLPEGPRKLIATFFPLRDEMLLIYHTGDGLATHLPRGAFEKKVEVGGWAGLPCRLELPFHSSSMSAEEITGERRIFTIFSNTFDQHASQPVLHYLTNNKVLRARYFDWLGIIRGLRVSQRFEDCMILVIGLANSESRFAPLHSTVRGQLRAEAEELALECVRVKLELLVENGRADQGRGVVATVIEFLLAMGMTGCLFVKVRDLTARILGDRTTFWQALTPFIEHERVKEVPAEPMREMLAYFIQEQEFDLIERLILNIDLKHVERALLIQCCLENRLVVSLAYICTQGSEAEFITPFAKLWSFCLLNKSKNEPGEA
jgi:hypothetical protein